MSKSEIKPPRNGLKVLIVENNPADAQLTLYALKEAGLTEGVLSLPDGDEALAYLHHDGKHSDASLPHIIFLDLNLPKKPGLIVLSELKVYPKLKVIPVIAVSGSDDPRQLRAAYELHANCFIHKPADLHELIRFMRACYEFWGTVATLASAA